MNFTHSTGKSRSTSLTSVRVYVEIQTTLIDGVSSSFTSGGDEVALGVDAASVQTGTQSTPSSTVTNSSESSLTNGVLVTPSRSPCGSLDPDHDVYSTCLECWYNNNMV